MQSLIGRRQSSVASLTRRRDGEGPGRLNTKPPDERSGLSQRAAALVERAEARFRWSRGDKLVDIARTFAFLRRLHPEQVGGMQLATVLTDRSRSETIVFSRHLLH